MCDSRTYVVSVMCYVVFARYSIFEILAGDVCVVNLFRNIPPAVSTECIVLIVCRQHNDKEWKFKEQRAKMWENIAGAKRYSRPRGFNIAGASAGVVPTSLITLLSFKYALSAGS